jgi:hypothetical protein
MRETVLSSMKKIILFLVILFTSICFSQVYKFDTKQVRFSNSWQTKNVQGYVVINDREIAIAENNIITSFIVYKIVPFGDEYVIYHCTDTENKKLKIVTEGFNRNKTHFQILISYPSVYWKYTITKI